MQAADPGKAEGSIRSSKRVGGALGLGAMSGDARTRCDAPTKGGRNREHHFIV